MKKEYSKPELNTKAYAQFENVFAACSRNPGNNSNKTGLPCGWVPDEPGNENDHHQSFSAS